MEHGTDIPVGKWSAPKCPWEIEFSTRVLDDIRLAVKDAFFSVPRGGAEIGGVLLGSHEDKLVCITDFEALDCEHAMGPTFTLSPRDQIRLAEMTARAKRNSKDRQPVGWYHSHTRSEIFLSEKDKDIHKRFFPEPWQIALVLKPHTFEPTRAGFFFREADGSIQGTATCREFVVEAMPPRPAASGEPARVKRGPLSEEPGLPTSASPMPDVAAADPAVGAMPAAKGPDPAATVPARGKKEGVPITREIPHAGELAAARPPKRVLSPAAVETRENRLGPRRAVTAAVCLALGVAAGAAGYQTRLSWWPQAVGRIRPMLPKEPASYLSLAVSDDNGQLRIRWDRNAPAVRNSREATLEISDGGPVPKSVVLDAAHLATGAFIYSREGERVDVALTAVEPNGQKVREQTSFLGKLPVQKSPEGGEIQKERDEMAQKAEKLQKDLNFQASKTRKLEKDLKEMHDQIEQRRMINQTGDTGKKN